ncbi:MAG: hypothetical protein WC769_02210 [Thermodesulfovibrionales bacterium]|jgi:deoxycytidine triphosphate deaminase
MEQKMINKITCAISSSLVLKLPDTENLECISIEANSSLKPVSYSILILDKSTCTLYNEPRFVSERDFDVIAYYDIKTNQPKDIIDACKVLDYILVHPGILAHQQIITLMKLGILIYDGAERRVKGASYDLFIDKEYLRSGIEVVSNDTFTIEPLDYIVAGASESVNLPKNICGNFDIKVSMFCKGVILSNGPQVDPGYQGRLLCLLFNTSAKEFVIEQSRGFEFSSIQFNSLSESTDVPYIGRYQRKQRIGDYIGQFADARLADIVKTIPETIKMQNKLIHEQNELQSMVKSHTDSITMINNQMAELQGKTPQRYSLLQILFAIVVTFLITAGSAAFFIGSLYQRIGTLEKTVSEIKLFLKDGDSSKTGPPQSHNKEKEGKGLEPAKKTVKDEQTTKVGN